MSQAADICNAYLKDTINDLIKNYEEKGLRASGRYAKGLTYKVEDTGDKLTAVIMSEGHALFMQQGRKPNKIQTMKQVRSLGKILEQWVKDKGIYVNPYAAAYKIVHKGIDVPNSFNEGGVIDDIITEEWYRGLIEKLSNWHIQVITDEVKILFMK